MRQALLVTRTLILTTVMQLALNQILSDIPITFQMNGSTTYTPDTGGSTINGYKLKLGYMTKAWLAIEFVGSVKSDVLVVQINDFYSPNNNPLFSGHQIIVTDYHKDSQGLHEDINNDKDISAFGYSNQKNYALEMTRYQGSNNGEDWNAPLYKYSVTQVCFHTSDKTFKKEYWGTYSKQCYYYQIQNFVSTFRGAYLKQFGFNGYVMSAFGYIDGPYLTDNLFLYQSTPLYTYLQQPAVILEIGTTKGNHGQDFQVWSPASSQTGDYFGPTVTSMQKDNTQNGGFENKALTAGFWNAVPAQYIPQIPTTNLLINFRRNISTFDSYDRDLLSTLSFCLYIYSTGSVNSQLTDKSCQVVELSYHYPRTFRRMMNSASNLHTSIMFLTIVSVVVALLG